METDQPAFQPSPPLLLRIDETARLLSVARTTVYGMINRGELPVVKCGTARRIPLDAVRAWIATHTEKVGTL